MTSVENSCAEKVNVNCGTKIWGNYYIPNTVFFSIFQNYSSFYLQRGVTDSNRAVCWFTVLEKVTNSAGRPRKYTRRWTNVGLRLGQRRNIKPTLLHFYTGEANRLVLLNATLWPLPAICENNGNPGELFIFSDLARMLFRRCATF